MKAPFRRWFTLCCCAECVLSTTCTLIQGMVISPTIVTRTLSAFMPLWLLLHLLQFAYVHCLVTLVA
jgi:hypothetical protein